MNYQHQTAFFSQSSMLRGERGVMTGGVRIGVTIGLCLELAGTVAGFTTAGFGALTTAGRETTGGREMITGRAITTAPCAKDDASRSEARSNFLRVRMLFTPPAGTLLCNKAGWRPAQGLPDLYWGSEAGLCSHHLQDAHCKQDKS
ncbi:hypothetical protein OB956_20485 [Aeromonas dhakensis]|uniref:hypothetical protein n=1 Tax=Aeromonas dhakensis TaxID=196024 RepID=UPI00259D4BDF|nr:hypothetical protein [Aeromonas dhakensis]MDM5056622.1 hypothetical protein [Aeromonas dhakensis]MDM5082779.1 hypothetical protein [Aeromonas dhakensis]